MFQLSFRTTLTVIFGGLCFGAMAATAAAQDEDRVDATVSTTMQSSGFSTKFKPELALDGSQRTYFLSDRPARLTDDFTVVLSKPCHVTSITVTTGNDKNADQMQAGAVEVSFDGTSFQQIAPFKDGKAVGKIYSGSIVAVRIGPTANQSQPLAIREITFEGDLHIGFVTRVPRIDFDYSLASDLRLWAERARLIALQAYPMEAGELRSSGFEPPNYVTIWFNPNYNGVAATSGTRIQISPKYVRAHMDDFGMVIHELAHTIQQYRGRGNPGWLVEGIADFVRFYLFEPQVPRPKINPDRAKYTDAYRTTAAFLAYAQQKYDRNLVRELNKAMRENKYKPDLIKQLTGKDPQDIWNELITDLKAHRTKLARL